VKYLVQLSNSKATTSLLNATYTKDNRTAQIAMEAMNRWREAGWSGSGGNDR
jgi:hypothetical protein